MNRCQRSKEMSNSFQDNSFKLLACDCRKAGQERINPDIYKMQK